MRWLLALFVMLIVGCSSAGSTPVASKQASAPVVLDRSSTRYDAATSIYRVEYKIDDEVRRWVKAASTEPPCYSEARIGSPLPPSCR